MISDDTQMALFTANGMLMGVTRGYMRGIGGRPEMYVEYAYKDWVADLSFSYRSSQVKAAVKVNTEMLKFYNSLGRDIF